MNKQVFDGLKVVEFAWAGVGPMLGKYLADHGATVIKIESYTRVCIVRTTPPFKDNIRGINRSGYFNMFNTNKLGISLNLNHPKGREVAKRFIAWADVVTESYAPGAMKRWGLNYDNLVKIKPDIIMISTCGLGQTGPFATQPIVGTQLGSMPGFTNLTGWPDRGPTQLYGAYTDVVAPIIGVCTLLAALDYRRRTGKGQHIDQSQFEAGINFLSPVFIEYMVNGREADRVGNRSHYATPHNAYPCQGNDRWCVITVFTDEEWQSFCQAIGNPQWTEDARFATLLSRKENEDELDNLVADWTLNFTAEEVMDRMQLFGIPAGVVNTAEDIHHDTQLKHRQHLVSLPHAELGEEIYENYPFKLSRTPAQLRTGAPCLGQHNEYVYTEILGMPDEEFAELLSQDILE